MFEPEIETMARADLARLQLARLGETLRHAFSRVALFRHRMELEGLTPDDVRSLADLRRLPFSTKNDLHDNYPLGLFAVPRDALVRIHASSGTTTGRPTIVGYTRADLETWAGLMARSLFCAGVRPGDMVHNAYGYGLFTGGIGVHYGAERLGCTVVPISGGNTARQITMLRDLGADVICSTPSYALRIAELAEQDGVDLRGAPLRLGVFGAEPWTEAMRIELETRLGITAVDIYGLSEVMGPGVAIECHQARAGMHGWEDHFIFEIIDPQSGEPLPPGRPGELVITTLTKQALPLIRYRTRDITRVTLDRCECGRTHLRLAKFAGRTDDMMIVRGVNVYPSQIEEILVGFAGLAPHYQLQIGRDGPLDTLTVEVEAVPGAPVESYPQAGAAIAHEIKSRIGVTCEVQISAPGAIPRSEGKAVRVRDVRRPH
jgi:phenylacetate-CoA ligase